MTIEKRKFLYEKRSVGGIRELDYLLSSLPSANIRATREFTVSSATEFRPDLVSKLVYGNYKYGWLIMDFNDIVDPYEELVAGKVLLVPNLQDYFEFFNENARVTREDR